MTDEGSEGSARRLRFELDPAAREERLKEAEQLRDSVSKGSRGDVSL